MGDSTSFRVGEVGRKLGSKQLVRRISVPSALLVVAILLTACAGNPLGSAIISGVSPRDGTPAERARRDEQNVRAIEEAKRRSDRERRHEEMEREYREREIARERFGVTSDGGGGGGGGGY